MMTVMVMMMSVNPSCDQVAEDKHVAGPPSYICSSWQLVLFLLLLSIGLYVSFLLCIE